MFEVPVVCNSVLSLSTNRRRQHPGGFLFSLLFLLFSLEKGFPVTLLSMKTLETHWRKLMQDETSLRRCIAHSIPCLGGKEEICMPWHPAEAHTSLPKPTMLSPTSTAALWRSLLAAGAVFRGSVRDCQEQLLQQSLCPYSLCRKAFGTWFQTVFSSCWRAPVSHKKTWLAVVNFSTVTHWNGWAIYYCCAGAKPAWERTMEDSSGIFVEVVFQGKWQNGQWETPGLG